MEAGLNLLAHDTPNRILPMRAHGTPNKFLPMLSPSGDVPSDFLVCDEEMSEGEDDSSSGGEDDWSSGDVSPDSVTRAGTHFQHQYGRHLNGANVSAGKGPFQMHNRGTTGGVTCFFCLMNYERDMPFCSCLAPIELGYVERPLRQLLRQKIKARKGEKFYARFNQAPLVLSRYVGAGPRYEKEPQHRTRPGDKDGEGGAASSTKSMPDQRAGGSEGPVGEPWQWEQLYFEYEVGKACRCVGEWCECDYSRRADGNEGPVGKRRKT